MTVQIVLSQKGENDPMTITAEATAENIEAITEFVNRELEARECPYREQMQICVAIDEIVSNIARYAYTPDKGNVTVNFAYEEQDRTVVLTFTDEGIPYDPLQREDPDVSLPAEKRKIGGLGIYLVRKTMDRLSYRRENGKNILTVRKKI